jgi:outer membrane protein TolC
MMARPEVANGQSQRTETRSRPAASPQPPVETSVFLGGVPSGLATADVPTITVVDAVRRALQHNLGVLTAEQHAGHAEGTRWRALSDMLPNITAQVTETRQEINLAAFGFGSTTFAQSFAGLSGVVGPFNVFDARVYASQTLVDVGALNNSRAEAHYVEAARDTYKAARDFVIHVAGDLYLEALAATAQADSARAQRQTAQALYNQAVDLKQSGLVAGIDVLRAEVELSTETQRVTATENDVEKGKLRLARVMGLPIGQNFALDPNLPELPVPDMTIDQAVARAYETRRDYQAALERVRAAEAMRRSVIGDSLPSVRVNADYGTIGLTPGDARGTFTVIGAVNVPIFEGGRTRGRLLEADADLRNRRTEAEDLKASIYYEIRTAFLDLQATTSRLQVATRGRDLASQQFVQARDRFQAGIASNLDVVQAQQAVALASEQFISAQYGYARAKGALARGVGTPEEELLRLIGGTR